ncbi:hypothetical protein [Achromobacter xylosoxidans]|nr:hypothetical protein HPS43_08380 [Achromobacter xylosoxidans]
MDDGGSNRSKVGIAQLMRRFHVCARQLSRICKYVHQNKGFY